MKICYLTTYDPSIEALGGASWVDRRVVATLSMYGEVDVHTISTTTNEPGKVQLEVRGKPTRILRTVAQILTKQEPYFAAKFRSDNNWSNVLLNIESVTRPIDNTVIVTSQTPALLACHELGLNVDLHIAHNVDAILAKKHDPVPLRILRDPAKMLRLEQRLLRVPTIVTALSIRDVDRLRQWGIVAQHWKLANSNSIEYRHEGRIGFLGKGTWPPNIVAVDRLLNEVMPKVREELGNATPKIIIGGRETDRWTSVPGVEVLGEVESAANFYRGVDLVVVPRMGTATGISVKMMEALQEQVPVVVPPDLASDAGINSGVLIASTVDEMSARIVEYYRTRYRGSGEEIQDIPAPSIPPSVRELFTTHNNRFMRKGNND